MGRSGDALSGLSDPARKGGGRGGRDRPGHARARSSVAAREFCRLAIELGADASGIDAAEGMIQIARRQIPAAHLCVDAIECLPWADDRFGVVSGFNSFQFADDLVDALVEAKRVSASGGRSPCATGTSSRRELFVVLNALSEPSSWTHTSSI